MGDNRNTYDAIVIGSGMSGGWSAKELCEKGLRTLLLERGRDVKHLKDYPTTNMMPWEFKHRGQIPYEIARDNPVITSQRGTDFVMPHLLGTPDRPLGPPT